MRLRFRDWMIPAGNDSYIVTGYLYDTGGFFNDFRKVFVRAYYFKSTKALSLAVKVGQPDYQIKYLEEALKRKFKKEGIPISFFRIPSKKDMDAVKGVYNNLNS